MNIDADEHPKIRKWGSKWKCKIIPSRDSGSEVVYALLKPRAANPWEMTRTRRAPSTRNFPTTGGLTFQVRRR